MSPALLIPPCKWGWRVGGSEHKTWGSKHKYRPLRLFHKSGKASCVSWGWRVVSGRRAMETAMLKSEPVVKWRELLCFV
jgi:hypothetical protein